MLGLAVGLDNAQHAMVIGDRSAVLIGGAVAADFAGGGEVRSELHDLMAGGEKVAKWPATG